ncbi:MULTISPECIES: Uma2 family endonuclease [Nostocales]|uniref:Uma2 family endonuclease n=3 Tax=Nostocales TaxID=1161 RepID=A0A0C1N5I8_9CYAN|nr:Uma2 family endonuclease [Tolypothrix bouteillei]KAF3888731.1 Uma2 family endonuclease [Tolypothrix bouteillei VB521301]
MNITTAKRFTISEYERLAKLEFFRENERVELIDGEIISMVSKGTRHSVCETRLERQLYELVGKRATLRGQQPIVISEYNEPEPDRAIVKNREDDYLSTHPLPSDILLLIEIADSSLKYDQEVKLTIYAQGGISDYWIFNLIDNCLECYSEPYQNLQGKFGYRKKIIFLPNETVNLPYFSDLILDLSKVFPAI